MQKIASLIVWISVLSLSTLAIANSARLQQLKSKYPYGLIGDDYGVLTEEDLAVNTCNVTKITPFIDEKNMVYSYWQCFALKNAKIECSSLGYDVTTKATTGYLEIDATNKGGLHSYLARDAMSLKACDSYIHRWKEKTRGENYVCLSGSYGGFDGVRNGKKEIDWVFDKFKTKKGCVANRSDCHLGQHPDKNCILP